MSRLSLRTCQDGARQASASLGRRYSSSLVQILVLDYSGTKKDDQPLTPALADSFRLREAAAAMAGGGDAGDHGPDTCMPGTGHHVLAK